MTVSEVINLIIGLLAVMVGFVMFWSLPTPRIYRNDDADLPLLSIIVPARNEAGRITPLLQSLQKQHFQSFELLVVDDHSTDHTADITTAYGATVLQRNKEGSGAGKSLACWHGAQHANGEWLLFLDADTYFSNADSLQKLLYLYNQKGGKGILSLQPYHTIHRLYENLSAIFNIIVISGMNVFSIWGKRFQTAGSFGPCIVCNKDDYFISGGHQKIQDAVMDDLALGEAFLEHNLPVYCMGGKGTICFRMYPEGFKSLVEGWCKSFAVGSKSTHPLIMLMTIIWISGSFISLSVLIPAIVALDAAAIILSSILYLLYAVQTLLFARRCGNFRWVIFLLFPILFTFFTVIFVYSLFRVHILHSVNWKGRKIDV